MHIYCVSHIYLTKNLEQYLSFIQLWIPTPNLVFPNIIEKNKKKNEVVDKLM